MYKREGLTFKERMESSNEIFACMNCGAYGPLNIHLRCSSCNSDAVVSATRGIRTLEARQENETLADWAIKIVDTYIMPPTKH